MSKPDDWLSEDERAEVEEELRRMRKAPEEILRQNREARVVDDRSEEVKHHPAYSLA